MALSSISSLSFAANFPLEITNIKAAGTGNPAIPATNRIFRAYPGIEYNIRPAVIGGLYPFTFSLGNAPSGMTIHPSTGEISWPNPQANAGPITLTVTDSENHSVSTSWSITVSTSGFVFVDANYAGTETGSFTQPFRSFASMLAGTNSLTTIVYFREGIYPLPTGTKELFLGNKPHTWLGFPGETPVITGNGRYLRTDYNNSIGIYLDRISFQDFQDYAFMLRGGHHYQTIRRSSFKTIVGTTSTNNNYGFLYATSASTAGQYSVIQDNDISDFTGASAIGSLYDMSKLLIEGNFIHNSGGGGLNGINNGISAKYRTHQLTVRGNKIIMNDGWAFGRGSMNGPLEGTVGSDVSFNYFANLSGKTVNNFNGSHDINDFHFYRNTVYGVLSFEYLNGTSCPLTPIVLANNVLINSNADSAGNYFTHDFISYGTSNSSSSTSPWNCITDTGNLKALPSSNAIDANGYLTSSYASEVGLKGWQTKADSLIPRAAAPKNLMAR